MHFYPFTEGFDYAPAGDIDALNNKLDGTVCAIMCEVVQGEGGVNILDAEYVKQVREICDNNDILLIIDEVQTGIARTGKIFAHENFKIKPDVMTLAKGLGGGLPIGACVLGEKCKSVLGAGDHGTTFGGNPAVCAGANVVMDKVCQNDFLDEVNAKGEYIKNAVKSWELPFVTAIRGLGLMIGIEVTISHKEAVGKCLDSGLMMLTAGSNVLRMLPPLTITYEEIDQGLEILKKVMLSYNI
jgi:acetylornithine/N-succinyldiaminopimelate aminotransferase